MNPKTKRRLSILLVAAVASSCALGGLVVYRKHRTAIYYDNLRKVGLADYAANDYHGAMDHLASYIRRNPNDSEALYACVQARLHVEEPNHAERIPAIGLLRSFVELNPDRKDAREQLLDLYLKANYLTETLNTADEILRYSPRDAKALSAQAHAFFYLRKYNEALKASNEYNKVAPLDLDGQILTLAIMQRRGASAEDIVARTDELLASHADDCRFELIKSAGYLMTNDIPSARKWAQAAAKHPDPDPAFLKMLIRHLDSLNLFADAKDLQEKAARNNPDIQTRDNWIARLLQSGQYNDVVDAVNNEKELDTDLLVYKALALIHLDRSADAQAALALLADHGKSDAHAAAAANAIDKTLFHPSDPTAAIAACNDALVADNQDPFFVYLLAKAYTLSGENELSEEHYKQSANIAPAWAEPLTALSKLYLNQGRLFDAYNTANQARLRSPNDREALLYSATSGVYLIKPERVDQFKDLLEFVQRIETQFPNEQGIIPVHVMALSALKQKPDALAVLEKALAPDFKATPETLLALAGASFNAKLGQEEACFSRYQQLYGLTPELVFAHAAWLARGGRPEDGLKYFEEAQAHQTDASPAWKINRARYLDFTNNPQAKKEWETLAENNPKDVNIQWQALSSRSTRSDRPFIAATIERLRNLRGDRGTYLSIVRARYILQGKPVAEKDLAEAVLLLSDVIRQNSENAAAHQLLAAAYFNQNNMSQGIEELTQAINLAPDNVGGTLELAGALHSQRNFARARPYIDRVAQNKAASPEQRRTCAILLAEEGDLAAAAQQFELMSPADLTDNDRISLASFYAQLGQPAKADELVTGLLQKPTPQSIQLAAELYGTEKRDADAQRALALLDPLDCAPAVKARIRAAYAARFGSADSAIQQFAQAAKANPKDAPTWHQLLAVCVSAGRFEEADRYAADAHAALPDDVAISTFNASLPLLHSLGGDLALRPVFTTMAQSSADAPAIAEALQYFVAIRTHPSTLDEPLTKLRQLADHSRDNLPVQITAARACLVATQADNAVEISTRAMQAFPNSPEAAQIAADSLAAAGHWTEALAVGNQWRSRLHTNTLPADLFIAIAQLELNKPENAINLLSPYLPVAAKSPDDYSRVIETYVRALLVSGQTEAAASTLKPLLSTPAWRYAWIRLASSLPKESDATAWLDYATNSFPSGSPSEKTQLALAYYALSQRTKNPKYEQTAVSMLEQLAAKEDCDTVTLTMLGSIYEVENNNAGAELVYRRVLKLRSDQPVVLNNLAMVILHRNGDLKEALDCASRAIALEPNVPNFFDTQATILAQQKAFSQALDAIDKARNLAPTDPEWQATRIWLLALSGQQESANTEFRQLQLGKNYASLSVSSRKRLASLGIQ